MTDRESRNEPFAFRPSQEALKQFKDASAEAKLDWLEEANRFVNDFVAPEKLQRWKRFVGR